MHIQTVWQCALEVRLLKIRIKMIVLFILIILIPIIFLYSYITSISVNKECSSQIYSLQNSVNDKAAYISEVIQNIAGDEKAFTTSKLIKDCADSLYAGDISDEMLDEINKEISNTVQKSPYIHDMYIVNKAGTVIAAFNKSSVGTAIDNYSELDNIASENNGISPIHSPSSGTSCTFYAVKRIYSYGKKDSILVCQVIDMTEMDDLFNLSGYSNYAALLLIDSAGKYISGSVSIPKSLEAISEYRSIPDHLSQAIPFYSETDSDEMLTAEFDEYAAMAKPISAAGWSMAALYNKSEAKAFIRSSFMGGTAVVILLLILSCAAAVAVCFRYTIPLDSIIHVINRKNNGDTNVRLELKTNDEFGEIGYAFNNMFDIMNESEQRYRTVISMMDNVVFEINMKDFSVYVSNNFNQKFSFRAANSAINESFLYKMKVHKDDAKRFKDDVEKIVSSSGEKWKGEYRLKNIYGDFSWIKIQGQKFFDSYNNPTKIIGMMADIDREKRSTMNLMQKANYDALTQLYNRASFLRTLDDEMKLSEDRKSLDVLMFIDLDDFKHFNDEYGHKCGDEVLKFVAESIKEITSEKGFGGRLGGDEFVMCLTNLRLIGDAGKIAYDLIKTLNGGFLSESTGMHFNIHCSVGIAFFRENGTNSTELLEAADTAMYKIKKSGKSNFAYADGILPEAPNTPTRDDTFDSTFLR